jgi:hypothetical protein
VGRPLRISDCAFPPLAPVPPDSFRFNETESDKRVNMCVAAATECHKNKPTSFNELQRENLIQKTAGTFGIDCMRTRSFRNRTKQPLFSRRQILTS